MVVGHLGIRIRLVRAVLCSLLLLHIRFVDGATDRGIESYTELRGRLVSSFYLLGYCSSPDSPECSSLTSLLESSEALTRGGMVKTGLLAYNAVHWQRHLNTSTAAHLWFACHDGTQIRIQPINNTITHQSAVAPLNTPSSSARAASAAVARSDDVPFYACPELPTVFQLDLLMRGLKAAIKQYGAACIQGQMCNLCQAAATAASATEAEAHSTTLMLDAAAAADPNEKKQLLTQRVDAFTEQHYQQVLQWCWRIEFVLTAVLGSDCFCMYLDATHAHHNPVNNVQHMAVIGATVPAAVALKMVWDMFYHWKGWTGTSSWCWALAGWIAMCGSVLWWLIQYDHKYQDHVKRQTAKEQVAKELGTTEEQATREPRTAKDQAPGKLEPAKKQAARASVTVAVAAALLAGASMVLRLALNRDQSRTMSKKKRTKGQRTAAKVHCTNSHGCTSSSGPAKPT